MTPEQLEPIKKKALALGEATRTAVLLVTTHEGAMAILYAFSGGPMDLVLMENKYSRMINQILEDFDKNNPVAQP